MVVLPGDYSSPAHLRSTHTPGSVMNSPLLGFFHAYDQYLKQYPGTIYIVKAIEARVANVARVAVRR